MRPIDIFATNSYSCSVIGTRDYSVIPPKIDYYASLPPPPPYTSSLYTVDDRKQNFSIDQLQDPYGTNEALVSLQNVKEYLLRIQSLSPIHDTISPTDKNTDIKSNLIKNFSTPSSVHNTQTNTMITDFSINEGLERIGTTLQQLIDEAQASLSGIPLEKPSPPPPLPPSEEEEEEEEENTSQGFANYSYQYVQKRYMQSQEKISVAFEQLEQSIQTMTFTNITTTTTSHSNKKSFLHYSKYITMFGTIATTMVILLSKYRKHAKPYKTISILLFIVSLYFKSSKESTIVNILDKFIIRILFGHHEEKKKYI